MPIDSTAVLGMSISAPFSFRPFIEHVHRAQVQRGRVVLVRERRGLERFGDLDFGLAEDDARLLLT